MTHDELDLGPRLAEMRTVPTHIQVAICVADLAIFMALVYFDVASILILIPVMGAGAIAAIIAVMRMPALCSNLVIHEDGLVMNVQGKARGCRYDQLSEMSVKLTHHLMNHQYMHTKARIELLVEGRFSPYVYECEYRRDGERGQTLALGLAKCSEAIKRRLLAELEREGAVRWRDNVSLTADGVLLTDSADSARLIPYRQIAEWKVIDNELKIWKTGDGLPCFVTGNETPNFGPLLRLFESLCQATRNIDPTCEREPALSLG